MIPLLFLILSCNLSVPVLADATEVLGLRKAKAGEARESNGKDADGMTSDSRGAQNSLGDAFNVLLDERRQPWSEPDVLPGNSLRDRMRSP